MRTWLKQLRLDRNLTEQQIADRACIAQPFYHNIEAGNKNPSPRTAKRIAEALGFDWTRFFDEKNNDSEPKDVEKVV